MSITEETLDIPNRNRKSTEHWTKEEFIKYISGPIHRGVGLAAIEKNLNISHTRLYMLFAKFGFKNKKDILSDDRYA